MSEFLPYIPPFEMLMPEGMFDAQIANTGLRLGWMQAHTCPCTAANGNARPGCPVCHGRGVYWDKPLAFKGLITYMHTASAPDEPGAHTDATFGQQQRAEGTLSIPAKGDGGETTVWKNASIFDAYVEYDAPARFNSAFVTGKPTVLPYSFGAVISSVKVYNDSTGTISDVKNYTMDGSSVLLPDSFAPGTKFVVEYIANPIYVAYRSAGALPHKRPFGGSISTGIPVRFRVVTLDMWLRTRFTGDGPAVPTMPTPPASSSGQKLFG